MRVITEEESAQDYTSTLSRYQQKTTLRLEPGSHLWVVGCRLWALVSVWQHLAGIVWLDVTVSGFVLSSQLISSRLSNEFPLDRITLHIQTDIPRVKLLKLSCVGVVGNLGDNSQSFTEHHTSQYKESLWQHLQVSFNCNGHKLLVRLLSFHAIPTIIVLRGLLTIIIHYQLPRNVEPVQ